jgi:hypothetical protein
MPEEAAAVHSQPFEPLPAFQPGPLQDDPQFADNRGKRIGILIVTYNTVSTLSKFSDASRQTLGGMSRKLRFSTTLVKIPLMSWQ